MNLTDQELAFCQNYLSNGFDVLSAYIEAGYPQEPSARYKSKALYNTPDVNEYIRERMAMATIKAQINVEKVLFDLERVKTLALGSYDKDLKCYPYARIKEYLRAVELQGKYLGMFSDKLSIDLRNALPKSEEQLMNLTDDEINAIEEIMLKAAVKNKPIEMK